jgi:hydroxymethylglutaryl-CoA synthase
MEIPDIWGVSTMPVHDFFKPRREIDTRTIVENVLDLARESGEKVKEGLAERILKHLPRSSKKNDVMFESPLLQIHKDTPVFDGQFSNRCYSESVKQAFINFRVKAIREGRYDPESDEILTNQWSRIIVHLPYAFQGKRMFPDVFRHDRRHLPMWAEIVERIGPEPLPEDFSDTPEGLEEFEQANDSYRRHISKTEEFKIFVDERIERTTRASSLIGNQYTGSIFLALMSTMESDYLENIEMSGERLGLCGYGSGAKAKVFEGIVQPQWREIASRFHLFERLSCRHPINKTVYEALHRGSRKRSVVKPSDEFALVRIGGEGNLEGQREYRWVE